MRGKFDVRAVHEFLNKLWEDVFTLNEELKEELPRFGFKVEDVEEVFGAYLFLDGEWRQMLYPHPAFEVKPQIEVGATPESYYFVVAVPKEKISEDFLEAFLEAFPKSFIYGSEDFLNDVYNCMRDSPLSEEIIKRIHESSEKVFQFEANFDDVEKLKEGLFKVIELGKRFEIFDL
ncbi:hypothetical protein, conserved [Thermococcus kodakarensis KOD1]|uniref:DUF3201 domain-containing protein n=1 Tax=Thermococcus kodakarensis (strain ATCC BAA-918 / JCM 12380 / KOD1) TaxID=69014 RepID=Q5JEW8_THEKO|nr:DUF3201 domain-containing protein [Thermococcus kodakarensis]WCN27971.1 DUF3201 domain-containing protein [Thermococcus kodakarensis]WCN30270.1 DUF3201 domain-containing protein [Thermococcus kodakarensis]BAD86310.1 hypothetical protein, conserved [Thermococcus kodakarensis KOD1]